MAEKRSEIKRDILLRVRWLYVLFIFTGLAIVARMLYIQFGPQGDELRERAVKITYERVDVEANRGDILDREGRILATSIPTYEIRMDAAAAGLTDEVFNREVDSLALCLSHYFKDRSKNEYKKLLTEGRRKKQRYMLVSPRGKNVNFLELGDIRKFPIFRRGQNSGGLIVKQVNKRINPHGSLAQRTIGKVNQSGTKLGIEGAFDNNLRGEDGNMLMQRISGSFRVPVVDAMNVEPVNGIDVVTTLDVNIQDVAETALKRQLEIGGANWGTVVLMEVATGEIRAMANLTRKGPGVFEEDFNYAIGMNLEPGSTFKLATLITLLDDGKMSLDKKIDTEGGRARVGSVMVVDDHKENVITLKKVFEVSSNIGFAKAVSEVYGKDPKRFTDYISRMDLDKNLDLQIDGGQTPVIWKPGDKWWNSTTMTMMSYGYGLRVTPMHTLVLYNAVANDGKMVRPILVRELREYGHTVRTFPTTVINPRICSASTLAKVRECLEGVVEDGTGSRVLKNPLYKVAGKTGTAQIAQDNRGYTDARGGRHYLATLVGYFPADKPKYTCIVAMKTYYGPQSHNTYYGSSLAGPVFRAIADRVYAHSTSWQPTVEQSPEAGTKVHKPALKAGNRDEIKTVANRLGITLSGAAEVNAWAHTRRGATSTEVKTVDIRPGIVPSVKGMGLKEAIYLLEKAGLKAVPRGVGIVTWQSVAAGSRAVKGKTVIIELENPRKQ